MTQIQTDAFIARLKPKNKGCKNLVGLMQRQSFYVEPKHPEMLATVQRLIRQGWAPVVDKRFGMIFGCPDGFHEKFRGFLYCYHEEEKGYIVGEYNGALSYVKDGLGYYISSMQPDLIVSSIKYRPDKFDKELFETYRKYLFE